MAALSLVAGLSGLTAAPAVAVEDLGSAGLPTTGYVPDVVAASGAGIILAPLTDDGSPHRVSADNGQTFADLTAPNFTGQVNYVGGGKVMYIDPTGDSDGSGDFFNLYTYDLAAGTTTAPVKVYGAEVEAADPTDAVVAETVSGYTAVKLATGARTALTVTTGGTPTFTLDGATALATSVVRTSDVLGTGQLDAAPLVGGAPSSRTVPGLAAAGLWSGHIYWVEATLAGANLCTSTPAALSGTPVCLSLETTDFSKAQVSVQTGPGWVVVRLRPGSVGTLTEYVYLTGTTPALSAVAPPAGVQSLDVYGKGDTANPLATVLTPSGGFIGTYSGGKVTRLFGLPQTTASLTALAVTSQSVSGLDDRPATGVNGQQAWTRSLDGVALAPEQLLSPRATALSVSDDRAVLTAADGVHVLDAGRASHTIAGLTNARLLSGPYFLAGSTANADVVRVDGATVLSSAGHVIALFGSLALRLQGAGGGYEVVDATHPSAPLAVAFTACPSGTFEAVGLWGDWILARDTDSGDTVVVRYRNGTTCKHHAGQPLAIGDNFALISPDNPGTGNPDLVAWNFITDDEELLASKPSAVATDGSHKVAWADATDLRTSTLDDIVSPSAPRVLGVVAPSSVAIGTAWTLDLDASKGLRQAGLGFQITGTAGSAQIDVQESPNGSVRLTWDGDIGGSPAPAGVYTWTLRLKGADNLEDLVNADGTTGVTGTVTVNGTLPPVTGTAPTVSPTSPVVGETVTVSPGAWEPNPGVVLSYQWYRGSTPIYLATGAHYTPVVDDLGDTLSVAVTGKAPGHTPVTSTSAPSEGVAWIAGPTPTLSRAVQVVGKQVSAQAGTWSPATVNSGLTYQWYRDATPIGGATAATYLPATADLGHTIKVTVTGSLAEHPSLTRTSSPSATVISPSFTPIVPVLSNLGPAVDQKMTATPGVWGTDVTLAYQWYRVSGKARAIRGATHADYLVSAKDVGYKLKVRATGTGMGKASLYSKLSAKVKKATFATIPIAVIARQVTGEARVGQTLTAAPGTYDPVATLKYQWYRASKAIKRATKATYKLAAADLHKVMKVRITASRSGYATVVKTPELGTVVIAAA